MTVSTPATDRALKAQVAAFWDRQPCGSFTTAAPPGGRAFFEEVTRHRYAAQPFMRTLVGFEQCAGQRVLEVGCGLGTDLRQFALAGARVVGVELSSRSARLARQHFAVFATPGAIVNGDAEQLPFADASFDVVYAFGVLHHTPDTATAIGECHRVLKPGGRFLIMLYNRRSWQVVVEPYLHAAAHWVRGQRVLVGALDRDDVVRRYDGPANPLGKAYTTDEVRRMLGRFVDVRVRVCHSSPVGGTRLARSYGRVLDWCGINRRWGFWIHATARRVAEGELIGR
jgi:ubiquinone/menaquinone biosynthesis C-methylase UbiE